MRGGPKDCVFSVMKSLCQVINVKIKNYTSVKLMMKVRMYRIVTMLMKKNLTLNK